SRGVQYRSAASVDLSTNAILTESIFFGGHTRGQHFSAAKRDVESLLAGCGDGIEVDEMLDQRLGVDHRLDEDRPGCAGHRAPSPLYSVTP
ncbi:MAG: hypothetical protein ACT4NY_25840, partial [Pseudonocardiales bacterium]